MVNLKVKALLNEKAEQYEHPDFIELDPISVPHRYTKPQDIEIMGFFAAILAWGQRKTIINKSLELADRMDNDPHNFILHHKDDDLKRMLGFKHRTFNDTDLLYFVRFLNHYFKHHDSLEEAFVTDAANLEPALFRFRPLFFSLDDFPPRTSKHIASPERNSTCKRLNMYLRWMVRPADKGVDFGLWKKISSAQLLCPLDLHVDRVARRLGLVQPDTRNGWKAVLELTDNLKKLDPHDPVKYDFALFGMGVMEKIR